MSVWADTINPAAFAGVEFDCLATRDSIQRSIFREEYARVNGARLQDLGLGARETTCRLIFWEREPIDGEDPAQSLRTPRERFEAFIKAATSEGAKDFVHPQTGTYRALVESLSWEIDPDDDAIYAECNFVEDSTEPATLGSGLSVPFDSSLAGARVQALQLQERLLAAGLDAAFAADAASMIDRWDTASVLSIREVNLDVLSLAATIGDAVDEFQLRTDLDNMPILRAMHLLLFSVRQAAGSIRQTQPQIVSITTTRDLPLLVILADYYGAREAHVRRDEVERLNDIDDPTLIPSGTTLRVPARAAGRRQELRRTA